MLTIGVDLMGSDSSPETLFDAVLEVAGRSEDPLCFVVFATLQAEESLLRALSSQTLERNNPLSIDFCFADEFISMEDDPLSAVRLKKGSTLSRGIQHLREGKIDALVTAGNTGSLIALSAFYLEPLGKDFGRPALLAIFPAKHSPLAIVDVGGNVSCRADHLVQYALIGAAYQRAVRGIEVPRIGLLNIGTESKKGTPEIRSAFKILKEMGRMAGSQISFVGNTEAREVFNGGVDVLVTDGFTGNVLLKSSQGISAFIFDYLKEGFSGELSRELLERVESLERRFDYEEYPGAVVCGVGGIVIKCHGAGSKRAMSKSIEEAAYLVRHSFVEKIRRELSKK